jgi:hypothetical protein
MVRTSLSFVFLFVAGSLFAQTPEPSFGLKLGKVPEAVYAQVPQLPKSQGILVEAVQPNSPAWRGGLRPFDVIVSMDTKPLADYKAVDEKLHQLRPGQSAWVTLFRAGREMLLAFDAHRKEDGKEHLMPKGLIKPGGPPAVTIQFQPVDNGRLNLVLSFYSDNAGKMESLAYNGPLGDIEQQIHTDAREKRLPDRVQDLVEVALKRVRTINQNQK